MEEKQSSVSTKTTLWILAVLIMAGAYIYQKRTGPTYPYRGTYTVGEKVYKHKLIRSEETIVDAKVSLEEGDYEAILYYKRYKTKDEFTAVSMLPDEKKEEKVAYLPKQPAAGKLEYYILVINSNGENLKIPASETDNILIRFKDPVPYYILIPHILFMFFSILIGMRAGLGAIFAVDSMRAYVWIAFAGMSFGGMMLGPIVQKYAFGEYWTGFPWGGDWTDNKMLIMWGVWLLAVSTVGLKKKKKEILGRILVIIAAIVMTIVYTIPHSIHGSELDYDKVDSGVAPSDAIKTGNNE